MRGQPTSGTDDGDGWGVSRGLDEQMRRIAARQHSTISREQLLGISFSEDMIDRRIKAGVLRPIFRGVYLFGPIAPPLAREFAAVSACGDHAYLSHQSAAKLWSLAPYLPDPRLLHLTVTRGDPRHRGLRVHRSRALAPDETTTFKRIPITTPAGTLLDIAPSLNPRQLERSLAVGIKRRHLRRSQLDSLIARHPGRPGVPALRRLLTAGAEPVFTRSEAERRFLALVRGAELPAPEVNASLGRYEIGFLWRSERLAVEIDGWSYHSDRAAFESDRRRDADLVAWGFRVIRLPGDRWPRARSRWSRGWRQRSPPNESPAVRRIWTSAR